MAIPRRPISVVQESGNISDDAMGTRPQRTHCEGPVNAMGSLDGPIPEGIGPLFCREQADRGGSMMPIFMVGLGMAIVVMIVGNGTD